MSSVPRSTESAEHMQWLRNIWAQLRAPFTVDDILNAESENALRDVQKGTEAVADARAQQVDSNIKLRNTMRASRARTTLFADFEERIRQRHH